MLLSIPGAVLAGRRFDMPVAASFYDSRREIPLDEVERIMI
jgi:hypothetical protein